MKHVIPAIVITATVIAPTVGLTPAVAKDTAAVTKAQDVAKSWLALTDSGQYSQSWDNAAAFFKASITKPAWEAALKANRLPLGALKSRKLKSATFRRSLPGAPDGEYVVIQFTSKFEKKAFAVETVTPMRDKDGTWRVAGYYIR